VSNRRNTLSAFTITELLVVISIIVLLIAIAVPAFSSLIYSSERSLAENQLRVGLSAGRDAAIQSEGGDGAAVFFFSPGGRVSIIPCVVVGQLYDQNYSGGNSTGAIVERDVLVQVSTVEPVQLPRGWSVRAFAPPGSIDSTQNPNGWYESLNGRADDGNWVFPETGLYSPDGSNGHQRQTFMVRFRAGTGSLDASNRRTALIFDPVPYSGFRAGSPWNQSRADEANDAATFVKRILARTDLSVGERCKLLGDESIDSILARPVIEVAMFDEGRLAASIGARGLNRVTSSLYVDPTGPSAAPNQPEVDTGLFPAGTDPDDIAGRIAEWIEGRYQVGGAPVPSDARIFTLQRYLGQVQEVVP